VHSGDQAAPEYKKQRVKWLAFDERNEPKAVRTAEILRDWIYIDELWVSPDFRGEGVGRRLIQLAGEFARSQSLQGLWL
jgi:GNAT superfamily N-acetyltransferase